MRERKHSGEDGNLKIKIGKVVINSMDDPTIHRHQLSKEYDPQPYGYRRIIVKVTGKTTAELVYDKRLLVSVSSSTNLHGADGNWIDKTMSIHEEVIVDFYKRETSWWSSNWKRD